MTEKRMLIVEDALLRKIDENRGEMSRNEFISYLIENQLGEQAESPAAPHQYVSREEYQEFTQGIKELLRHFLDFFLSYGLELGQEPKDKTFAELVQKLQALSASGGKPKAAK
jgi:hypothetical protein